MTVNVISVDSVGECKSLRWREVTPSMCTGQFFGAARIARKGYNFLGGVFGFVAARQVGLFSVLIRTADRTSVAICTCFELLGSSRVLVRRPLLSGFLARSVVIF